MVVCIGLLKVERRFDEEEKCAKMRCFVGIMQHTAHVAPEVNDNVYGTYYTSCFRSNNQIIMYVPPLPEPLPPLPHDLPDLPEPKHPKFIDIPGVGGGGVGGGICCLISF